MQDELANLTYPILSYGLTLKNRLDRGDDLELEREQGHLKGMLMSETEAQRWVDFGGDAKLGSLGNGGVGMEGLPVAAEAFLGIRFALVCWLDELFVLDSAWSTAWNERKLEASLYGSNDRAWRFWEQAQRAEKRPNPDALEAFFLCVILGFRGEYIEDPIRLDNWINTARAHINRSLAANWPYPPELEPPINVPPRRGRDMLENMVVRGGVLLLILVPLLVAFLIQQLSQ